VIASGLTFLAAMTFDPDCALYVSNFGFGAPPDGEGQICENHSSVADEPIRLSDTKGDRWKLLRQQRTGSRIHRSITRETSRPLSPKGSSLTVTS
jgi:hypothetical protein